HVAPPSTSRAAKSNCPSLVVARVALLPAPASSCRHARNASGAGRDVDDRELAEVAGSDSTGNGEWRASVAQRPSCLELPQPSHAEEVESSCRWVEGVEPPVAIADAQSCGRMPARRARPHRQPAAEVSRSACPAPSGREVDLEGELGP